ncbi:MAG: TonB-dependent receptor domain-containing protein, partial [Bryobacteraceae bacterium]
ATKYIRSPIYAGFVQDDWKVRPNLTLNLGLRWEYFHPVYEKYGNISNVILGPDANPLLGLRLKVGGDLYNGNYNNWGPQFGFAWRPHPSSQRFVMRGGFGIGYNRMQQAITLNGRNNPPLATSFTLTGTDIFYGLNAIPSNVSQFSGYPANPNARQQFDPATGLPLSGAPLTLTGFPLDLPTPYTYRYSLDTQYDLGSNWVASLGYQGSSSRHYTRQNNLNFLYGFTNPRVQRMYYFTNDTNGNYNALLGELEHRFSNSFQMDAQYRWSRTIDEGSNDYFIGEYPYGRQYFRGLADFDVRHLFKLYGVWSPRFGKGNGWVNKVLGGWEVTGILNWHTGFPWTPIYNNTSCNVVYENSGYCDLRPANYLGGAGTDYSNDAFVKPNSNFPSGALAHFTVPPVVTNGIPPAPTVGRNVLEGPQYFNVDSTLQKSFGLPRIPGLGENAQFQFRANFFNLFNKINLTPLSTGSNTGRIISTNGVTSNPLFGLAQSALGGRTIELQARFSF